MRSILWSLLLLFAIWARCTSAIPQWTHLRKRLSDGKYFHEPGNTDLLGHYDSRYFTTTVMEEERKETLRYLIKAYLTLFEETHLETWIAHGTLLGWWWNGKILPWDWDVDVQVAHHTLLYIGEHLNGTITTYTTDDGSTRNYLLDINPHSRVTGREDGKNIIDARFIDTHNGLYIDITGLHESDPSGEPGIIQCKNRHKYHVSDIYPLRKSQFEGVNAWIPYRYTDILAEEYPKGLTAETFYNHDWEPQSQQWIPNNKYNDEAAERDAAAQKFREDAKKKEQEAAQPVEQP